MLTNADETNETKNETYIYARANYRRYAGFTDAALDEFRRGIRYDDNESYACIKCGVEQRIYERNDDNNALYR
jgi:hypothetical protein